MNPKQLQERMAVLAAELDVLGKKSSAEGITDDESREFDTKLAEYNDLGPKVVQAEQRAVDIARIAAENKRLNEPAGTRASGLVPHGENGFEPTGNGNGTERAERLVDMRSIGRRFVESDVFKEYAKNPRGPSGVMVADDPGRRNAEDYLPNDGKVTEREARALIYTGGNVSDLIMPQRLPGFFGYDGRPLRVRDLFLNTRTTSNSIEFIKETVPTNAAVEVAEATATSGGGFTAAAKPESGIGFEIDQVPVVTIATFVPVTKQALEDIPQIEGYINGRLMGFIAEREDAELLIGNGVAANMTGIMATSGIQVLDAAYFVANPLPTSNGALPNDIDRIRRARTQIRVTGRANADGIVMHPYDSEKFDVFKDANGNYIMANPRTTGGEQGPLWRVPVVECEVMTPGTALVGAFRTMAAVYGRTDVTVSMATQHADWFTHNMVAILAEARLALAVYRPAAFATVELEG